MNNFNKQFLNSENLKQVNLSVTEFLMSFFPDENEPLYLFAYSPKEIPDSLREMPTRIKTTRRLIQTDRELQSRLQRINNIQGLYFVVNAGGTLKPEINRINAVFCEIDDLPIQDQHDRFDAAFYPPSIRVETCKSVHAYWLLDEDISIDDFIFIQRGLIETFESDKAIKNQNRVMRLPFFNHVAFDAGEYLYKSVNIHTFSYDTFTLAELKEAYSPTPQHPGTNTPSYKPKNYESNIDGWEKVFEEVRRSMQALPSYHVEHGGRLASAQGICHHGETNRTLVLNLQTGVVFCRDECTYADIMRAFGIEPPKKQEKIITIPRVTPRPQSSELYQWLVQQ